MNYLALLSSSVWALLRNKMRSLLTVLGITIGIAAVICVVAIGKAGQARVEQQLNNLGRQLRLDRGRRTRRERRAHRAARHEDADARRRRRDQEPDSADQERLAECRWLGPGRLRQPELVHDLPRRLARVLRHQALGGRRGSGVHAGRRRPGGGRVRDRPNGASTALRRRRPDRQGDPIEEPAVQGGCDARAQGALALRPGPGRHDPPPVHDGAEEADGNHLARRHPLLGCLAGRRQARRPAGRRRFSASAITCAPRRRTTSTSATRRT